MSAAATMRPKTEAEHASNNMGLLRVVLALLVIVAHSFELTGDRSTELLVRAFGTLTFGEVAVDGFFLLSGFLITKSYQHSSSYLAYLRRRILRIYPGFVVAYSLCLLIVVPLSGAPPIAWTIRQCVKQVFRMLVLDPPSIDGAFPGLLVPQINLSMWTISYEFRCYLLVIALGAFGMLRRRWTVLALTLGSMALIVMGAHLSLEYHVEEVIGRPTNMLRLGTLFTCGSLFYLFDREISYSKTKAGVAAAALFCLMFSPRLAEPGVAIFGGYLLFWFAFHCPVTAYSRFDGRVDLSYGIYLYAYPIQNTLIYFHRGISPWAVMLLASLLAAACAFVSWFAVEQPFMRLKQRTAAA